MNQEKDMLVPNRKSIFVHSLFRSGSTYIFNVFRRSEIGYWCYQEPLHELAYWARGKEEMLLEIGDGFATVLRHPKLERPYFYELHEVADKCLPLLKKELIYDAYFPDGCEHFGQDFFGSLIEAARGTAVIQECRTPMRIGALKRALGGLHIYLWRNPWDQWWSYKVDDYFDIKSQLCINGQSVPEIVHRLRKEVGFSGVDCDDLKQQFSWFGSRRLSPEKNYLIFYVLWLLGLQHGLNNADVLVNMDRLSDDLDYRRMVAEELESKGAGGLDFRDCVIPQACYGKKDQAFHERIEDRAHGLFLLSGTSQEELSRLLALRQASEPEVRGCGGQHGTASSLLRDAERARELVRQVEQREVESVADVASQVHGLEKRAVAAETRVGQLELQILQVEDRVGSSESRAAAAEARLAEFERRSAEAEAHAQELQTRVAEFDALVEELMQRATSAEGNAEGLQLRLELLEGQLQFELSRVRVFHTEQDVLHRALASAQESSNHWRLAADQWHERVLALHRSNSWRVTAPMRAVKRVISGDSSPLRKAAGMITRQVRQVLRPSAVIVVRAVLNRPRFRYRVGRTLQRYPVLRNHVLLFARNAGLLSPVLPRLPNAPQRGHLFADLEGSTFATLAEDAEVARLSVTGRQIYAELKQAIQQNKQRAS